MTLPDERSRAIRHARKFLRDLLDPKATPKVPKSVRKQAYAVLRHFPSDVDINVSANKLPSIWDKLEYIDND